MQDLFVWRNDPATRAASFFSEEISLKTHNEWFEKSLNNSSRVILIALDEECKKLGMVRFDAEGDCAEISVNLHPEHRGKGLGTLILRKASDLYLDNFPHLRITAKIKKSNIPSFKAFTKAGYKELSSEGDTLKMYYRQS